MNATLSVLDALRPPVGFQTDMALGTTYSADLVACMVALTTLDGASGETSRYDRLLALRALTRLRGKVRIAVQNGRIAWHRKSGPSLVLLDHAVVRAVSLRRTDASFHPKVWVIRQRALQEGVPPRYVLVVGSRNLTTDISWDLGALLVGHAVAPKRTRCQRLPGVHDFLTHVCRAMGDEKFATEWAELDAVHWELPQGVERIDFGYQPGGVPRGSVASSPLVMLPRGEDVLILSPFLDAAMVSFAANHWSGAQKRRLVAGLQDLTEVAASAAREDLAELQPHSVDISSEQASGIDAELLEGEEEMEARGLHAKVIAVGHGKRATVLLGSANLSSRGWTGPNCEAFLTLVGPRKLADGLWDWSGRSVPFELPPLAPKPRLVQPSLEDVRNAWSAMHLRLRDFEQGESILEFPEPLPAFSVPGADVVVARLSQPELFCACRSGDAMVRLPACAEAERTCFLLVRARLPQEELAWIQIVELDPPIDDRRDRAALVKLLGVQGFLQYVRSLIDAPEQGGLETSGQQEDEQSSSERNAVASAGFEPGTFELEAVLRRLCSAEAAAGGQDELVAIDRMIRQHREQLENAVSSPQERALLERFWGMWAALVDGMRMP